MISSSLGMSINWFKIFVANLTSKITEDLAVKPGLIVIAGNSCASGFPGDRHGTNRHGFCPPGGTHFNPRFDPVESAGNGLIPCLGLQPNRKNCGGRFQEFELDCR